MNNQTTQTTPLPSTSTTKSHLLRLPTELRLQILYQALLSAPRSNDRWGITVTDSRISKIKTSVTEHPEECVWGNRDRTALLLINRQLHLEAEDVYYSRFSFEVPAYLVSKKSPELIQLNTWSLHAMLLIQNIRIGIALYSNSSVQRSKCKKLKLAYGTLRDKLPRLRSAVVRLTLWEGLVDSNNEGFEDLEDSEKSEHWLVPMVLDLVGVFRGLKHLELAPCSEQEKEIVQKCKERMSLGTW